jgi:hypothetical protein
MEDRRRQEDGQVEPSRWIGGIGYIRLLDKSKSCYDERTEDALYSVREATFVTRCLP